MPFCLVGLGSNVGDRQAILENAVKALAQHTDVKAVSKWHSYPAVGGPGGQGDFLNGAVVVQTDLTAIGLAERLHQIELAAGRQRAVRWSARTLDCDLLLFGVDQINTPTLTVPHPRMVTRRFVLEPACEVAPEMVHPQCGWSVKQLLRHLDTADDYFCVIGSSPEMNTRVAAHIVDNVDRNAVVLEHVPFARSEQTSGVEYMKELSQILAKADSSKLVLSTFWFWDLWLSGNEASPVDIEPTLKPKLIIVTDPLDSEFGRRFVDLKPQLRVPALFLPTNEQHAMQDAVGAVLAMK